MNEIEIKFTAWIRVLIKRVRIDYFRRKLILAREVFFDDLGEQDIRYIISNIEFEFEPSLEMFEDKILSDVYDQLTNTQRAIIYRLYVRDQTIAEIAECTGWSSRYIYNQKYLAIKRFREIIKEKRNG